MQEQKEEIAKQKRRCIEKYGVWEDISCHQLILYLGPVEDLISI